MAFGSSGILIILKPMTDLLRFLLLSPCDFPLERLLRNHRTISDAASRPYRLLVEGNVVEGLLEVVLGFHGVPPLIIVLVSPRRPGLVVTASPSRWPLGSLKVVLV